MREALIKLLILLFILSMLSLVLMGYPVVDFG